MILTSKMKNYQNQFHMSQVLNFKKITKHMLKNITLSQLKIPMIKMIGKDGVQLQKVLDPKYKLLEMIY